MAFNHNDDYTAFRTSGLDINSLPLDSPFTQIPNFSGFEGSTTPSNFIADPSTPSTFITDGIQSVSANFTDRSPFRNPDTSATFLLAGAQSRPANSRGPGANNSDYYRTQDWMPHGLGTTSLSPCLQTNTAVGYLAQQLGPASYNDSETPQTGLRESQFSAVPSILQPGEGLLLPPTSSIAYASPPRPPPPPAYANPALPGLIGIYPYYSTTPYVSTVSPPSNTYRRPLSSSPPFPQPLSNPSSLSVAVPPSQQRQQQRHLCPHCAKHINRKTDLKRHIKTIHIPPPAEELYQCPVEECEHRGKNGFVRKDKLGDHVKKMHRDEGL